MEDYESILLVKSEVFVYKIPPRTTNRGYRAADWNLGAPDWTGRMRLVDKNKECIIKLEDKTSGELFAQCPIEKYPGVALEAVTDSSRYFVLRIQDEGGRAAFIGLGFGDRSDSFDLNVALQDHFKYIKNKEEADKVKDDGNVGPALNLGFKDGQTIKINMKITKKEGQENDSKARPKPKSAVAGFLPPPPGGVKLAQPPASTSPQPQQNSSSVELISGLQSPFPAVQSELWGDFASAKPPSSAPPPSSGSTGVSSGWVTF